MDKSQLKINELEAKAIESDLKVESLLGKVYYVAASISLSRSESTIVVCKNLSQIHGNKGKQCTKCVYIVRMGTSILKCTLSDMLSQGFIWGGGGGGGGRGGGALTPPPPLGSWLPPLRIATNHTYNTCTCKKFK